MNQERVFLTTIPGLEKLALEELQLKAPLLASTAHLVPGGLELQGELHQIHSLQTILKIPTRFLWRVLEFKARDLPKVYQKTKRFSWRLCFQNPPDKIHCHTEQSRLMHTDKITETVLSAIDDSLKAQAPKKRQAPVDQPQQLYIRVVDDIFTLSRDLTGIALHYRSPAGEITSGHEASVRRTIAAAMFMNLWPLISQKEKCLLIDPMMGSGTLLEEAWNFFKPSSRQFAADLFLKRVPLPCDNLEKEMQLIGLDLIRPKTIHPAIQFYQQDCFTFQGDKEVLPIFILSNPPYGVRIQKEFSIDQLMALYLKQIKARASVFLAPRSWDINACVKASCIKTRNSGLAVHLWKVEAN